jgi:hypothetical protein
VSKATPTVSQDAAFDVLRAKLYRAGTSTSASVSFNTTTPAENQSCTIMHDLA